LPALPDGTGYVPVKDAVGSVFQLPALITVPVGLCSYVFETWTANVPVGDPVHKRSYEMPGRRLIFVGGLVIVPAIEAAFTIGLLIFAAINGLSDIAISS
jgi:hypothetical protein